MLAIEPLDAKQELVVRARALEAEKRSLCEQRDELKEKLDKMDPSALQVHTSLAGARALCSPQRDLTATRAKDASIAARNKAIDCLLHLSNLAICKALDDMFRPPHAPQFPDSWFRICGAKSFVEAYHECPHLVHTLISKRRRRQSP